jgi:hypothetical protein
VPVADVGDRRRGFWRSRWWCERWDRGRLVGWHRRRSCGWILGRNRRRNGGWNGGGLLRWNGGGLVGRNGWRIIRWRGGRNGRRHRGWSAGLRARVCEWPAVRERRLRLRRNLVPVGVLLGRGELHRPVAELVQHHGARLRLVRHLGECLHEWKLSVWLWTALRDGPTVPVGCVCVRRVDVSDRVLRGRGLRHTEPVAVWPVGVRVHELWGGRGRV